MRDARGWVFGLAVGWTLVMMGGVDASWIGRQATRGVIPQVVPGRQVTVFAILATPGSTAVDPQLNQVAAQLQRLLPNHAFRLIAARNERLGAGRSLSVPLPNELTLSTTLAAVTDAQGKVQLDLTLKSPTATLVSSSVRTPPNQLVFLDKTLETGQRLVFGLAAR
jgi:hypothetical protein